MARHIVVTGTGRGLGLAMTQAFVAAGHRVSGCSRNPQHVERLTKQFPLPHHFQTVDVRDDAAVEGWAGAVLADAGAPDLLINNAAVINANAALWEVPPDDFRNTLMVNVQGVFQVLRHFLPAMIRNGSGVIVNFSSTWGRTTSPEVAPYCASKFAIEGLTQSLAQELPDGLAAVAFNPGVIHTDMLESCFGGGASAYPKPESWAKRAVPMLLGLGPRDNGKSLSAA